MIKIKKWKLALLTFIPFLGIIDPILFIILIFTYFIGWVIYLQFGK